MGVWAAGNFDNDEAMDYAHELVDQMIEQIEITIASEHGMDPDEPDSFRLMCNIELMWLIGQHTGISLPEAMMVETWKAKYLATWEGYIDGLDPEPQYKVERRNVISRSFDQLVLLCRNQEQKDVEPHAPPDGGA